MKNLAASWNRFWFEPQSPEPMGLFRIFFGLILLANGLFWGPDLFDYFGPHGFLSLDTMRMLLGSSRINLFEWMPETNLSVVILYSAYLAAALLLTLGLFTRVSSAVLFVVLVSFHHRNLIILHSGDTLERVILFLMIFSEAGSAYSLDVWRKGGKIVKSAPWAQRLIQYQFTLSYVSTVLWKLDGASWIDGTAMYYAANLQEFWRYPVPYIFEHLWILKLLTWLTLIVELALGTLIWVKAYRYRVIFLGVLLHLGIEYSMNIQLFEWLMLALYIPFIEPEDLRQVMHATSHFCRRNVRSLQRFCGLGTEKELA